MHDTDASAMLATRVFLTHTLFTFHVINAAQVRQSKMRNGQAMEKKAGQFSMIKITADRRELVPSVGTQRLRPFIE